MNSLSNNKLFWVLLCVVAFNVAALCFWNVVIDKISDKVFERFQEEYFKEYSPSPFGPGVDPDKINPKAFNTSKQYFELKTEASQIFNFEKLGTGDTNEWRNEWEASRGIE